MSSDAETSLPAPRIQLTPQQWRAKLTPNEYQVLREAGTERAFTGEYTDTETEGVYDCRACGAELFRSGEKFHSHCGWPSFFDPAKSDAVILRTDDSLGQRRVRGAVRQLPQPPRARVRGRGLPHAHGQALLHQLHLAAFAPIRGFYQLKHRRSFAHRRRVNALRTFSSGVREVDHRSLQTHVRLRGDSRVLIVSQDQPCGRDSVDLSNPSGTGAAQCFERRP